MPSWLRRLREALALVSDIGGAITFIALVIGIVGGLAAGLARLWLGQKDLLTAILVVVGAAGVLAGCAYIFLRWYIRRLPSKKVIILVADFQREGTDEDDYNFTGLLLERLRNALAREAKVEVQTLRRAITAQEGSHVARLEGERRKAAFVIWGWYGMPPGATTAVVSVHFEVLRQPKYMPSLKSEAPRTVALTHLQSFDFQTQLSKEMAYLAAFTVGVGRLAAGEWEGAIRSFTVAMAQTDEPVQALNRNVVYFYRGSAYLQLADYERAITDYDRAVALNPDDAEVYNNRGTAYAEQGQYERAIADFDQAIALKPNDAEAHNNRGLAYANLGQYQRAIADFDQAIALQPDYALAYYNRGIIYKFSGEKAKAVADFRKVLELSKDVELRKQAEEKLAGLE
jgi:tetratricopeptide (TPR) repeat protein